MSVTWVARFTLPSRRCERSPRPVIVGANTLWPRACRRSETRRQHQPPCQAPCTSTKVLPACAAAGEPPSAAAPTVAAAIIARRVTDGSFVSLIAPSQEFSAHSNHRGRARRGDRASRRGVGWAKARAANPAPAMQSVQRRAHASTAGVVPTRGHGATRVHLERRSLAWRLCPPYNLVHLHLQEREKGNATLGLLHWLRVYDGGGGLALHRRRDPHDR